MYQRLSSKVDLISYRAAIKMIMAHYPRCKNLSAWNQAYIEEYQECTNQISRSNSLILKNMWDIENFLMNRKAVMSIQVELEQILEGIALDPNTANGLKHVIDYINTVSSTSTQSLACSGFQIEG